KKADRSDRGRATGQEDAARVLRLELRESCEGRPGHRSIGARRSTDTAAAYGGGGCARGGHRDRCGPGRRGSHLRHRLRAVHGWADALPGDVRFRFLTPSVSIAGLPIRPYEPGVGSSMNRGLRRYLPPCHVRSLWEERWKESGSSLIPRGWLRKSN